MEHQAIKKDMTGSIVLGIGIIWKDVTHYQSRSKEMRKKP